MKTTKNVLARSFRNSEGSVAPIFGLMAMPMFFCIGVSVDYSRAIGVENSVQSALDSAALAAMIDGGSDVQAVGQKFWAANFHNADATTENVIFTKMEDGTVRATASVSVETTVAVLLGINTLQVETFSMVEPSREETVEGETTTTYTSNTPCLHVMDQNGSSFQMTGNKQVDAANCIVKVRSNSSSSVAASGNTSVKFKRIKTKGNGSLDLGAETGKSNKGLDTDQSITGSPYDDAVRSVLQSVSVGSCTNANTNKSWTGNVSPGTYCGTTEFKNATFASGLYIIKSGSGNKVGRLKINGNTNASAGVTFYLADNKSQISQYAPNDGSVFKAPATGVTRGLLFVEDSNRGASWAFDLSVSKANEWQGIVYLPSANMEMDHEDWVMTVGMAVNKLTMDSIEDLKLVPYSWTPHGYSSPITLTSEDDDATTTSDTSTVKTDIYLKQ